MSKIKLFLATLMMFCGLVFAPTLARAETMPTRAPQAITSVEGSAPAEITEVEQLEQRENAAQELEDFEGGDTIVITGSAIAIALLIVLIIVAID